MWPLREILIGPCRGRLLSRERRFTVLSSQPLLTVSAPHQKTDGSSSRDTHVHFGA